jgi:hypothetical protein
MHEDQRLTDAGLGIVDFDVVLDFDPIQRQGCQAQCLLRLDVGEQRTHAVFLLNEELAEGRGLREFGHHAA